MKREPPTIEKITPADENHQVVTLRGAGGLQRNKPCPTCPWRIDATGIFPAEAFRISAPTAYDAAFNTFACHESGQKAPATCAGFLLRNSANNIGVRIATARGDLDPSKVVDGGVELYDSYRAMAIGNGVPPDDPVLAPCRNDDGSYT